jgi:hypothetical protein
MNYPNAQDRSCTVAWVCKKEAKRDYQFFEKLGPLFNTVYGELIATALAGLTPVGLIPPPIDL